MDKQVKHFSLCWKVNDDMYMHFTCGILHLAFYIHGIQFVVVVNLVT